MALRAYTKFDSKIYCVAPYSGRPEEWLVFQRAFELRMTRDYANGEKVFSTTLEVLKGIDLGGEINMPDITENIHAKHTETVQRADGKNSQERKDPTEFNKNKETWLKEHKRRNAHLILILLSNIVNDNLIQMLIGAAPGDGYKAWQVLKNHCYQEPDNLVMSILQREW